MSTRLRGLITVAMAQLLGCEYMLSVAAAVGTREGLSSEEFEVARNAESHDPKIAQALRFAKRMVENHGHVEASEVAALHEAGYGDEEIVELIGAIALNLFRNYFNLAVQTEIDFPLIRVTEPLPKAAAR